MRLVNFKKLFPTKQISLTVRMKWKVVCCMCDRSRVGMFNVSLWCHIPRLFVSQHLTSASASLYSRHESHTHETGRIGVRWGLEVYDFVIYACRQSERKPSLPLEPFGLIWSSPHSGLKVQFKFSLTRPGNLMAPFMDGGLCGKGHCFINPISHRMSVCCHDCAGCARNWPDPPHQRVKNLSFSPQFKIPSLSSHKHFHHNMLRKKDNVGKLMWSLRYIVNVLPFLKQWRKIRWKLHLWSINSQAKRSEGLKRESQSGQTAMKWAAFTIG